MIQWKQRLYAFLLRRLLGPFLDASATKQLHDSLDFSIQEGTYTLKDISLNATHLNSIIASGSTGIAIRSARIGILKISLELRENVSDHEASERSIPRSSLAWRAMKLGTGTGTMPAVSLIATIEINDVILELEPSAVKPRQTPPHPQKPKPSIEPQEIESSRSVLGSYVDAALSSLQLDLKTSNISVKVSSSRLPVPLESWMEIRFSSIAYRDFEIAPSSSNTSGYKTILNKSLEFTGLRIQAGDTLVEQTDDDGELPNPVRTQGSVSTIALARGHVKVFIRVIEYEPASLTAKENDQKPRLQQDVEVTMNQQLNLSVDQAAMLQLRSVAVGLSSVPEAEEEPVPLTKEASDALDRIGVDNSRSDQEDLAALNGILKQYQEAYHLAERNELRGGILIPSNAYEDGVELEDDEPVTFDAFFDANEQSVYHYASVLKESLLMSRNSESKDEFVHTKLRLHLMGGGFKLVFADPTRPSYVRRLEEYLLLTFDDLNFSSSMSLRTSDHSFSVSNLEIEDAQIDKSYSGGETFVSIGGQPLAEGRVEIGNVLRFASVSSGIGWSLFLLLQYPSQ
jgi:hypothetical protein